MNQHPAQHRSSRLTVVAVVVGMLLGVSAAPASAASYVVQTCGTAGTNHAWTASNGAPNSLTLSAACGALGAYGGLSVRGTPGGPNMADGSAGQWTFTAPASLTVSAITYSRWLWKTDDDDLQPQLRSAEGAVLEGCSIIYPQSRCDVGASGGSSASIGNLATTGLSVRVGCHLTSGHGCVADGGTVPGVAAVMYSSAVTVTDNAPPVLNGAPTGTLLAGGWARGSRTVVVGGSDASGIQDVIVDIDGQSAAPSPQPCDYSYARPCGDVASQSVPVDTSQLTDGPHTVRAGVRDAAGNTTLSPPVVVNVDNTAPSPPVLLDDPPAWTANPAPTIRIGLPSGQASPITAVHWTVCDSLALDCGAEHVSTDVHEQTTIAPAVTEGHHVIRIWLSDEAGNVAPTSALLVPVNVDTTAPAPPTGVAVHGVADHHVYATWDPPADDGSPITAATVRLCTDQGCSAPTSADVNSLASLGDLAPGSYTVDVWFTDGAGNQRPQDATRVAFVVPAPAPDPNDDQDPSGPTETPAPGDTTTPQPPGDPARPPTQVRANPRVKVTLRARPARKLTVTVTARAPGSVAVRIELRDARGHRLRLITRKVKLRSGRGQVTLTASRTTRRASARASTTMADRWLAGTSTASVRLPATFK